MVNLSKFTSNKKILSKVVAKLCLKVIEYKTSIFSMYCLYTRHEHIYQAQRELQWKL